MNETRVLRDVPLSSRAARPKETATGPMLREGRRPSCLTEAACLKMSRWVKGR